MLDLDEIKYLVNRKRKEVPNAVADVLEKDLLTLLKEVEELRSDLAEEELDHKNRLDLDTRL